MKKIKVPRKLKKLFKKRGVDRSCPDCIADRGQCFVCWSFENHPEDFTLTGGQQKEMNEASEYIRKHNLQPNLDGLDY